MAVFQWLQTGRSTIINQNIGIIWNWNSFQQSKDTLLSCTDALLHLRYHNDYYSAKTLITTLMKWFRIYQRCLFFIPSSNIHQQVRKSRINVHDNGSYFYSQHIMIDVQDNGREWSKRVWNCSVTWAPGQIRQKCYQRYKFLSLLYDFDLFVIPSLSLLYVFRQQWMICILQWQHDGYMCTFLCNWFFCIMTSSIVK